MPASQRSGTLASSCAPPRLQYTLYPDVLIPQMVAELSRALSWTFDHVPGLGGNASKVRGS
jgi:hypothetical protein